MNNKSRDALDNPIVQTAILIAGLTSDRVRTRDVLFYVDLVKNIFQAFLHLPDFDIQPVQILRRFRRYEEQGHGEIWNENAAVYLRLNGQGIFHVLSCLMELDYILPLSEATFLQWFIDSYQQHITKRLEGWLHDEQRQKLASYLQPYAIFRQQWGRLQQGAKDMEERIQQSSQLVSFIRECQVRGLGTEEIVAELPSEYSYRLSHQKRLTEWLAELPSDVKAYEIEEGIANRQNALYARLKEALAVMQSFYTMAQKPQLSGPQSV